MNKKIQLLLALFLMFSTIIFAQTTPEIGSMIRVKMENGNNYQGELTSMNDESIVLESIDLGSLTLSKSKIKKVIPINEGSGNKNAYLYENPNATRYIFAPSGYGLRKGEGYYHNFMLVYNSVSYGFTNNFTLGLGVIPIIVDDNLPFSVTPKVSIPVVKDKFNLGVGTIFLGAGSDWVGVAYGVATYGSREKNISLGMGWGYVEEEWSSRPVITASGMLRIGRKWGLVTENWFFPSYEYTSEGKRKNSYMGFFAYSARYIAEPLTIDFGFVHHGEIFEVLPLGIPIVGVVFPFGRPYKYRKAEW